jgi:hypothetical protein
MLVNENKNLREELQKKMHIIQDLKNENLELKLKLQTGGFKREAKEITESADDKTFLTKGSILPTLTCENW